MTEEQTLPPTTEQPEQLEHSIVDERPIITEDNKYHTRGCHCAPSQENTSRAQQMCSCAKLATFDWTNGLTKDDDISKYTLIEVRFKNSRKDFFRIVEQTDVLAVGASL